MTKAFDAALFIPANPPAGGVVDVATPGPPLKTQWGNYIAGPPGISVDASVPAANAQGQSLISGPAPDFEWEAVATSSTLPVPTGPNQTYVSDQNTPFPMILKRAVPDATGAQQVLWSVGGGPYPWTGVAASTMLTQAGAVTNFGGGSFTAGSNLAFAPTGTLTTRVNGTDPAASAIDNFTIDAGTF